MNRRGGHTPLALTLIGCFSQQETLRRASGMAISSSEAEARKLHAATGETGTGKCTDKLMRGDRRQRRLAGRRRAEAELKAGGLSEKECRRVCHRWAEQSERWKMKSSLETRWQRSGWWRGVAPQRMRQRWGGWKDPEEREAEEAVTGCSQTPQLLAG